MKSFHQKKKNYFFSCNNVCNKVIDKPDIWTLHQLFS